MTERETTIAKMRNDFADAGFSGLDSAKMRAMSTAESVPVRKANPIADFAARNKAERQK